MTKTSGLLVSILVDLKNTLVWILLIFLLWIESFLSLRLVAWPKLKNLVCPTIIPINGVRIDVFPKDISAKWNAASSSIWTRFTNSICNNNYYNSKNAVSWHPRVVCLATRLVRWHMSQVPKPIDYLLVNMMMDCCFYCHFYSLAGWAYRIHRLHLCRETRLPKQMFWICHKTIWRVEERGVPLYYHRSQGYSGPEWLHLIGSYLWVK